MADGRVVVVTGGGQGIGRQFARAFAQAGAVAVIPALDLARASAVAAEIAASGGKALALGCDVSDPDAVGAMADRIVAEYGRIDVLINNAAIFSTLKMRPFYDIPFDEWQRVLHVNIDSVYLWCRPCGRPAGDASSTSHRLP